jgi:threonine dehydratase
VAVPDDATRSAMRWLYERHGLRTEPSGAITVAALLAPGADFGGAGDVVAVVGGRNVDEEAFRAWIAFEPAAAQSRQEGPGPVKPVPG